VYRTGAGILNLFFLLENALCISSRPGIMLHCFVLSVDGNKMLCHVITLEHVIFNKYSMHWIIAKRLIELSVDRVHKISTDIEKKLAEKVGYLSVSPPPSPPLYQEQTTNATDYLNFKRRKLRQDRCSVVLCWVSTYTMPYLLMLRKLKNWY